MAGPKIQPVIGTVTQLYDYLSMTDSQQTGVLQSHTSVASYAQDLLDWTAWRIVNLINYDFTTNQRQFLRFYGNDLNHIDTDFPIGTLEEFTSFDPQSPTTAVVNIGTAAISVADSGNPYRLYRIDGNLFDAGLSYYIQLLQRSDPAYAGWPPEIEVIQMEMCATIWRESSNSGTLLNVEELQSSTGRPLKIWKELEARFVRQLRPFRQQPI